MLSAHTALASALQQATVDQQRALYGPGGITSERQLRSLANREREDPPALWLRRAIADALGRDVRELFPS